MEAADRKGFSTPILFIIYNRKEIALETFQRIRELRPERLFIAADGPKAGNPEDERRCLETRKVVESVDWPCELHTRLNPANLGLKKNMSSAIHWFFERVEAGIILEDDCKPDSSFFEFCAWALEAYRDDRRVMAVSGANYQFGVKRGEASFYFSKILACWGWATWRRAWALFDLEMKSFPEFESSGQIRNVFPQKLTRDFWMAKMSYCHQGGNSWAFAWIYNIICNNGLVIIPNENLVSNVGFDAAGTNAKNGASVFSNIRAGTLGGGYVKPPFVLADCEADRHFTEILAKEQFIEARPAFRIKRMIKRMLPKAVMPK